MTAQEKKAALKQKNLRLFLKRKMRAKKMTYKDIATKLKVHETTVKKWMTIRDFKMENLIRIGDLLGVDLFDLVKFDQTNMPDYQVYTPEQDAFFAENPMAFLVFIKIRHHAPYAQLKSELKIDDRRLSRILAQLETYKVAELWPYGEFKMKLRGPFTLRPGGRMMTELAPKLRNHLFGHFGKNFPAMTSRSDPKASTMFRSFSFHLTESSRREYVQDLMRIIAKYAQIAEAEIERKAAVKPVANIIAVDQYDSWLNTVLMG
jgi:transcriptional regulator with XRE-family HTH domain